jgi:hypothetical protein
VRVPEECVQFAELRLQGRAQQAASKAVSGERPLANPFDDLGPQGKARVLHQRSAAALGLYGGQRYGGAGDDGHNKGSDRQPRTRRLGRAR